MPQFKFRHFTTIYLRIYCWTLYHKIRQCNGLFR